MDDGQVRSIIFGEKVNLAMLSMDTRMRKLERLLRGTNLIGGAGGNLPVPSLKSIHANCGPSQYLPKL